MRSRKRPSTAIVAVVGAGALAAALLSVSAAQAEPVPAPQSPVTSPAEEEEEESLPTEPVAGSLSLTFSPSFAARLRAEGITMVPIGMATLEGRTLTTPVFAPSAGPANEVVAMRGGMELTNAAGQRVRCAVLSVARSTGEMFCVQGVRDSDRAVALQLLATQADLLPVETEPSQVVTSPVSAGAKSAIRRVNTRLGARVFRTGEQVGALSITLGDPVFRASRDSRAGCDIDDVAGDNSRNRGWAVQALVNRIPKGVSVSQFDVATGEAPMPDAAPVAVGQRTPKMEGVSVTESKRIIRGSYYDTDNFWSGPTYGCASWAPFVVGQGGLDEEGVQAWNYDGNIRGLAGDPAGRSRTQWWAHARQTNYNGPTGSYTWTCRGLPTGNADTFWARVSRGTGFFGDGSDASKPDAGRAPACRDDRMRNFTLTTRYSISKLGGLEARDDQNEYPRYCSVTGNDLVGCWQEIYPLGWDRAWAFQYHVYASALRASMDSNVRIRLPNDFSDEAGTVRALTWRISDATITGAWPKFTDDAGVTRDMSGVTVPLNRQDLATPSAFTVPAGLKDTFTLAGYGRPMGNQRMTFLLTGDTDGTWTWPVSKTTGRALERPQIRITIGFTISNFDNGGSCEAKTWYDNKAFGIGRNNDSAGPHCIEGQVPTIWPLPKNADKLWQREIDEFVPDKDGVLVPNAPTTTFTATVLASCYKKDELTIQDNSPKTAPVIGADYTWNIRLAGTFTQLNGC